MTISELLKPMIFYIPLYVTVLIVFLFLITTGIIKLPNFSKDFPTIYLLYLRLQLKITKYSIQKAEKQLDENRKFRQWIENNPHVHILNYAYYRFKYKVFGK